MNFEYRHLLPEDFSPKSRVWVYQSSRLLSLSEAMKIEADLADFTSQWLAHGAPVKGYGNLFFGQFIVLMADETATMVSGCSTDSSVRFIKELGENLRIDFFERNNLAFVIKDKIQLLPLNQLSYAFENNFINGDTLYFNNLVLNKQQLEEDWLVPVKDSWLAKKLKLQKQD
jgi:hypothetical protein